MTHTLCFETALLTHPGTRPNNEDRADYINAQGLGCWVVADGLGGHAHGEVAAEAAVEGILAAFRMQPECSLNALRRLLDAGQAAVQQQQQLPPPDRSDMRTTAVILLADSAQACWAHAGDSRLYLFRGGQVSTRTRDHSVAQALVSSGELAEEALRHDRERSLLLRDLGAPGPVRATIVEHALALEPGDVFLLCTDGFWEPLLEPAMEAALSPDIGMEAWLKALFRQIEDFTDPGQDNYTALAVRVG